MWFYFKQNLRSLYLRVPYSHSESSLRPLNCKIDHWLLCSGLDCRSKGINKENSGNNQSKRWCGSSDEGGEKWLDSVMF